MWTSLLKGAKLKQSIGMGEIDVRSRSKGARQAERWLRWMVLKRQGRAVIGLGFVKSNVIHLPCKTCGEIAHHRLCLIVALKSKVTWRFSIQNLHKAVQKFYHGQLIILEQVEQRPVTWTFWPSLFYWNNSFWLQFCDVSCVPCWVLTSRGPT